MMRYNNTDLSNEQKLIDDGYAPGKRSFEVIAKEIHEQFDWNMVHKTMTALGWHWFLGKDSYGKDNMGVPSIETIKNHAYNLLKKAYEEDSQNSTGGFSAGWDNGHMYLVFTLEETTTNGTTTED